MSVVLGITGGIATGKSTASSYFEKKGVPVVDADLGARVVVEAGSSGLDQLVQAFGIDILAEDGTLDRKKLGRMVFSDTQKRQELNQIVQKDIRKWIESTLADLKKKAYPLIVLDIPLLFEEHYEDLCDIVLVIATTPEKQQIRLRERDGLTEVEARDRLAAQWPLSQKKKLADVVIENSSSLADFDAALEMLWQHLPI